MTAVLPSPEAPGPGVARELGHVAEAIEGARRIALRLPNWLGDAVIAAPAVSALRARFPAAEIDCVAHPRIAPLLPAVDGADRVVTLHPERGFAGFREDVARVKARAYDLGILFTDSASSAVLFWAASVGTKVGQASEGRGPLLDGPLRPDRSRARHLSEYYRGLTAALGATGFRPGGGITVPADFRDKGDALLRASGVPDGEALVGLSPGARYGETKRWPAERYRELATRLSELGSVRVLVLGDPSEEGLTREVARGIRGAVALGGRASFEEFLGILPRLRVLVANDSGAAHLGAAAKAPIVALFGSTSPVWTAPAGEAVRVLTARLPCSPCFRRTCPIDVLCLREIPVEDVFRATVAYLATEPAR